VRDEGRQPSGRREGHPWPGSRRKLAARLAASTIGVAIAIAAAHAQAQPEPSVLVLHSYTPRYRWTELLNEGIRAELDAIVPAEHLAIEYMDARRMVDDARYFELLFDLYRHKFARRRPDIVLVADDSALTFALEHRDALFGGAPLVVCGINSRSVEEVEAIPNATGILEGLAVAENLELIRQVHPDVERIVLLADRTSLGVGMTRIARSIIPRYDPPAIEIWDDFTWDELLARLVRTPPHTAYLILAIHRDAGGRYFSWDEDTPVVTQRAPAPVYAMFGMVLGTGVVGGAMNDPREHGREAATMVRRILEGTSADAIPVVPSARYRPHFDDAQLRRFEIDDALLPAGSIIVGRRPSFYQEHAGKVWAVVVTISAMALVIVFLSQLTLRARRAERRLTASQSDLKVALRVRDDLVMAAAHELRTPLTPLALQLESFRRKLRTGGRDELADKLATSIRQVKRLSDLVRDILLMSEIQTGRLALHRGRADLVQVVRQAIDESSDAVQRARSRVTVSGVASLIGTWDEERLVAAAAALISNAAKFGEGGEIEVEVSAEHGVARLAVRDHGAGLPAGAHERLFGPLVRAAPIAHYGGLGVGLFITSEIVVAHGGRIWAENAEGGGARFVIELPHELHDPAGAAVPS
jgi:signal transduction histidine kinase